MTPIDLANWQARLGLSQVQAAQLLKMPVQSYRNLLKGRRHAKSLPGPIAVLCELVEQRAAPGSKVPAPHAVLSVTPEEIKALDEKSLTELLRQLLHVEAKAAGLPQFGIHVPGQVDAADQGEDGRIEWSDGPEHTAFLPARLVQFQVKATDMGPAKCAGELLVKNGAIRERIRNVVEAGGIYVVFCNRPMTQAKIDERTSKMWGVLKNAPLNRASPKSVAFWDANKIAAWVNEYYPVALWVIERVRPGGILPFQSMETWANDKKFSIFRFVDDSRIGTVAREIEGRLGNPKRVLRLVGPSGLGKTRLALEAFRAAPSDFLPRVLYTHGGFGAEQILRLVHAIREHGKSAIIVVDDCPLELHKQLADVVEHSESRLSLLTIDYDLARVSAGQAMVEIDRADDQVIIEIIRQAAPHLKDADADRLVQFAQGYPQIAVLVANAWPFDGHDISSLADAMLVERMVFGRGSRDPELLRVARALSIFDIVGFDGEYANEMKIIAVIAHVDPLLVYGYVQTLIDRGLVQKRGRFVQVQPKPIALSLAADMLKPLPANSLGDLVAESIPPRLKQALFRQLSRLDRVEKVKEAAARFCAPGGPFANATFLDDEVNAQCLAHLAEVNPAAAVGALENAYGAMPTTELRDMTHGRRWIVWALERLCFREETFYRAAKLMLDFAVAENEEGIGNNATGIFKALFKTLLSGTEVPAINRLSVIDDALASPDPVRRKIAIGALQQALETQHFSRMGGAESQGSGPTLNDWRPTTRAEIANYYRACLDRLTKEASGQSEMYSAAKAALSSGFRGLIGFGLIDDVCIAVDRMLAIDTSYWPEAVQQISQSLRFEGPGFPLEYRQKLEILHDKLAPRSLEARLRLYVCELPWGYYEPGDEGLEPWKRWAKIVAEECGRSWDQFLPLVPILVAGEQRHTHEFGRRILEFAPDAEKFIDLVVNYLEAGPEKTRNPSFLGGLLASVEEHDPGMVDRKLDGIANNASLVQFLPWLTANTRIDDRDIARVVTALRDGRIKPNSVRILSMGSVLSHLSPSQVAPLIDALLDAGTGGYWAAVEILDMYVYQTVERYEGLRPQIVRIVASFDNRELADGRMVMETHHFGRITRWLLSRSSADKDAAMAAARLASQIVQWCAERSGNLGGIDLIESLLRNLLTYCSDVAWPVLANGIAAQCDRIWAFEHPIGKGYSGEKTADGPIFLVPWQALRSWCHRHPDFAPAFLMRVTSIFETSATGDADPSEAQKPKQEHESAAPKRWHPIVLQLLDDFGDRQDVLSALTGNMMSFSWQGSLVPYYEQYVEPLRALVNHHRPSVVAWAKRQLEAQAHYIRQEQSRDDEREFGVY